MIMYVSIIHPSPIIIFFFSSRSILNWLCWVSGVGMTHTAAERRRHRLTVRSQHLILLPDQWLLDSGCELYQAMLVSAAQVEWWCRCWCDPCDPGHLFGAQHWIKCGKVEPEALMLLTHSSFCALYFPSLRVSTRHHKSWVPACFFDIMFFSIATGKIGGAYHMWSNVAESHSCKSNKSH